MPPRKRQQSNAMLYTLIAFVGLFMAAATAAIVFYVKAEDFKTKEAASRARIVEIANSAEQNKLGAIVGAKPRNKSWLGTLAEHFDSALALVTGTAPQDTHAEAKLATARDRVKEAIALAQGYVNLSNADPCNVGLTTIIADLKSVLDNKTSTALALENQLADLHGQYDDAMAATHKKEQLLQAEKDILQQQVAAITDDYNKLRTVLEQTTDERVKTVLAQLDDEKTNREQLNQDLLRTQAQLELTEDKMIRAQGEVAKIQPPPDANAPAMIADGKIIIVDLNTKVVYINKGRRDRIYRGLTFAVHDRNAPLPKDGKGKAEIEVFDVQEVTAAARIVSPNSRRPVLTGDVIANLIWDSTKKNVFVVAGEFDLDNKGGSDDDAHTKMKALVEKWGGKVDDAVSVDTDYLVLGKQPPVLKKPTFEQIEIDPQAMDKFDASVRVRNSYDEIRAQAETLCIPTFNYDRFLNFIGYKKQSANAGAF